MRAGSWKKSLQVMGLGLTSMALSGCPMVQDFEFESNEGDAGSVVAPSQWLPPAVDVPDPDPASCPEACTGGCMEDRCRIDCIMDGECKEGALVCPAGFDCIVSCIGTKSCEKASIECSSPDACQILCDAPDACKDGEIVCGDGDCDLECGSANHACEHATVICGAGRCAATCSSGDALPKLERCDTAAECQTCAMTEPA